MKYIVVDACLNGTGIRDNYNGGYIPLIELGLSDLLIRRINNWLVEYSNQQYEGFADNSLIDILDQEGIAIANLIKMEIKDIKVEYFSSARMTKTLIC